MCQFDDDAEVCGNMKRMGNDSCPYNIMKRTPLKPFVHVFHLQTLF